MVDGRAHEKTAFKRLKFASIGLKNVSIIENTYTPSQRLYNVLLYVNEVHARVIFSTAKECMRAHASSATLLF